MQIRRETEKLLTTQRDDIYEFFFENACASLYRSSGRKPTPRAEYAVTPLVVGLRLLCPDLISTKDV